MISNFRGTLVHMDAVDPRASGIYTPSYRTEEVNRFMTSLYSTAEGVAGQDFDNVPLYKRTLGEAIAGCGKTGTIRDALEIGAGFGAATFAFLQLEEQSSLVCTELSVEMLCRLRQSLDESSGFSARTTLLQLNMTMVSSVTHRFVLLLYTSPKICPANLSGLWETTLIRVGFPTAR